MGMLSIARTLSQSLTRHEEFRDVEQPILTFAEGAKLISETMRRESSIFEVWPRFVAASEALAKFKPQLSADADLEDRQRAERGSRLLEDGRKLITWLGGARVPMPKSTREFIDDCKTFARESC